MQRKQKDKDEVTRLQFQAIANQINPHYSYNILNTIGYSILNEDSIGTRVVINLS